jgi:MFS superfamily sulfate permease-like transporter
VRPWIKYTIIRVALFTGVLVILMLWTPAPVWLSPIIAAIVGLCVSYIFFRPQRDAVAESIAARRERGEVNSDADEDTALDRDQ